jgi:hypothetical protein
LPISGFPEQVATVSAFCERWTFQLRIADFGLRIEREVPQMR